MDIDQYYRENDPLARASSIKRNFNRRIELVKNLWYNNAQQIIIVLQLCTREYFVIGSKIVAVQKTFLFWFGIV